MSDDEKQLRNIFRGWLVLWLPLLIPWFFLAPLSGLAYDRGETWREHLFVLSVWTYPLSLIFGIIFRKRAPVLLILPFLNAVAFMISS